MKIFISLLMIALLSTTSLWAQNIVAAEYYIDTDAGFGQNTPIPLNGPGSNITQSFTVDLSDVSIGSRTLWVRVKDDQGRWSIVTSRAFLVENIIPEEGILAAEYFVDEDLGFGNNQRIPLNSIGSDVTVTFTVDLSDYKPGIHMLYARTLDVKGNWSIVSHMPFVVVDNAELNNIIALEYYYYSVAEEAIVGSDTLNYRFSEPKAFVNEAFPANVQSLSNGEEYILYVWAIDVAGRRSLASTTQFKYCNNINGDCRKPLAIDSLVVTNIGCVQDELGKVEIAASGDGIRSYSLDNVTFYESNVFTGLREGTYTVYVKSGTEVISEDFIIRVATVVGDCPDPSPKLEFKITNTTCATSIDGEAIISVVNGGSRFTYSIDGTTYVADSVFTDLASGDYTAYAQSADTTISRSFSISSPDPIILITQSAISPTCAQPQSGSFTVVVAGGAGDNYTFRIDGVATQTNGTFTGLAAGNYQVIIEDENGCSITTEVEVPADAAAPATPIITSQSNADPEALATEVILTVSNVSGIFTWFLDGEEVTGESSNQITLTSGGAYTVLVTNAEGCPSAISDGFQVTSITNELAQNVLVFPNPVQADLQITLPKSINRAEVSVYNLQGKAMIRQTFTHQPSIRLETRRLPTGTYLLQVTSSKGIIQQKIQKY
ncbi:T9SS type A sorting domain-containing protein [Tunicatimonas pelagia]|uniref:T9SS type A sorting domain-containing protein n=1 Tax=Tunicatimonas pelagia TaxID=931531 RepID=UPI002666E0AC|nr:T9SS type A sorting domain-containing protein [Tunicatimonas pelagia]WKN45266.1 T9SS type A sorting domain-containing protein [Tunicatimonas pelagia]